MHGRRTPGEPAARADDFAPFAAYCRQRLADDPHLRTPRPAGRAHRPGLPRHQGNVLPGAGTPRASSRTRARDCHPASISGYSPLAAARSPQPSPLPVPAAPVAGETLASFLGRLAAVNRTSPDALLDILPPWFRIKARWHDDRWQPGQLIALGRRRRRQTRRDQRLNHRSHQERASRLRREAQAGPSGPSPHAASARRPAASSSRSRSTCPPTTRSASGTASGCPGREHRSSASADAPTSWPPSARHAGSSAAAPSSSSSTPGSRHPAGEPTSAWKRRTTALIESNPRPVTESGPQELFLAAAYPEAIAAAAAPAANARPEQSSLTEAARSRPPETGKPDIDASRGLTIKIPLPRSEAALRNLRCHRTVGGLDIHRKQITFLLPRHRERGGAARPDQPRPTGCTCGPGWPGSPAVRTSRSRWRGAPGGGTSPRSWPRPGSRRIWPSRPKPRSPAAASGTPRPTRPTRGTCGCCWPRAGCRSAGSRPPASWSAGRCWSCTTTCAASAPPGRSASTRCCSTRAPRRWARARCAPSRAWPGCGPQQPAACPRPGSCRSPPPWR